LKKLKQTVLSFGVRKELKVAGRLLPIFYNIKLVLIPGIGAIMPIADSKRYVAIG